MNKMYMTPYILSCLILSVLLGEDTVISSVVELLRKQAKSVSSQIYSKNIAVRLQSPCLSSFYYTVFTEMIDDKIV